MLISFDYMSLHADAEFPWVIVEETNVGPWDTYHVVDSCDSIEGARAEVKRLESNPGNVFESKLRILYLAE